MYGTMVLARKYYDMLQKSTMKGEILGMHHLGQGQEAIGTGIIYSVNDSDTYIPTHRQHAGQLYRADLKKFTAEQFGKVDGYCQGLSCDYHMYLPQLNMPACCGMLGQNYPIACGMAYALKMKGNKEVVVVSNGDGAMGEGMVYEAFYMATMYKLPIVFVVEDNGFAISFSSKNAKTNFAERAKGFGIPAVTVDGNDVLAVREAMEAAVEKARNNEPVLVECKTLRVNGHHSGDFQPYRDPADIEAAKANDPIPRFEKQLYDMGAMTIEERDAIWAEKTAAVEEAKQFAMNSPFPTAKEAVDYNRLYANPWEV